LTKTTILIHFSGFSNMNRRINAKNNVSFTGKIVRRRGRLPLLVVGIDRRSGKYRTKQMWSASHSRTWLEANAASPTFEVGAKLTLHGNQVLEITKIESGGHCELVYPEVELYSREQLIEFEADKRLGDHPLDRPGHKTTRAVPEFCWRQQRPVFD
jgi:hypothetical protein